MEHGCHSSHAAAAGEKKHLSSARVQADSNSVRSVVVVDDSEIIADTLVMVLSAEGFQAVAAYSASHALKLLQAGSFDVLITDVMMPGMTGIELAIEVTRRGLVSAVLLMSGVASTADLLENARKLGYTFEILAKPIYPTEVIERVHTLLALGDGAPEIPDSAA
ncbi:response regulator transcription factor [Occallatibacter savannae]|uniref:response regulator transcription factor n=1 Tax=Occallatibacter savannae TaxID=1002691 RepID=UPI000D68F5B4|nr:response regulator [Occallatibacter savannae]